MTSTLTSKGQVTIPKRIRDELQLLPGVTVQFSANPAGELVLRRPPAAKGSRRARLDRFDAVRGHPDVHWRTLAGQFTERVQRSDAVGLKCEQADHRAQPARVERSAVALRRRVSTALASALALTLALAGKLKRSFGPAPWLVRFGAA